MTTRAPLRDSLPLPYRPSQPPPVAPTSHRARRLAAVLGTAVVLGGLGIGVGIGIARADGGCVGKWTAQNWQSGEARLICEALYGTTRDGVDSAIDQCVYDDRSDDVLAEVNKYRTNPKALSRSMEFAITTSHIARSTCEMNAARTSMATAPTGGVTATRQQDPRKAEYESGYTAERDHRRMTDLMGMALVVGAIGAGVFGFTRWRKRKNEAPAHVAAPTPPQWCENHEPAHPDAGGSYAPADAATDEPSRDQNQGQERPDGGDDW